MVVGCLAAVSRVANCPSKEARFATDCFVLQVAKIWVVSIYAKGEEVLRLLEGAFRPD